jgi:hypothetical protein
VILKIVERRLENYGDIDLEKSLPDWIVFFDITDVHIPKTFAGSRERGAKDSILDEGST